MVSRLPRTTDARLHSLPFMRPKYPPPPPPLSLDDAKVTPEVTANWFSFLYFNWVSPMMALGDARPLEATDLWRMDDKRSAGRLAGILAQKYEDRKVRADEYNAKLADPRTPLPWRQRLTYPLMPNREQREADFRAKGGKKRAQLAFALLDVFGWWFWIAGILKLLADVALACSPLLIRALIRWATTNEYARKGLIPKAPKVGEGIGMAIGLFFMLCFSSVCLHHYFYRTMGTGVLARSALISAIYERSLRLTQKARGELPNGKSTSIIVYRSQSADPTSTLRPSPHHDDPPPRRSSTFLHHPTGHCNVPLACSTPHRSNSFNMASTSTSLTYQCTLTLPTPAVTLAPAGGPPWPSLPLALLASPPTSYLPSPPSPPLSPTPSLYAVF